MNILTSIKLLIAQKKLTMKLYIEDINGNKRYINLVATSRSELAQKLGGEYFSVDDFTYHVSQVNAEKSSDNKSFSTIVGGALGLAGGMPGILIGGALGAILGSEADKKELNAVASFNRSLP
ncbi:hypothetical protein [Pectobacterium carotovorum]|uniref:hypothetical protein n=1 Tax=Pectobacterium carotovorum TaxID=554 RepID=UPI00057E9A15|nr:hypothetical protein [Pectobacterium carotovorum]KHT28587.1 hypothetical protein RC98_08840 [Pectobacterium carotovorum subsp. carotovorum]MBA0194611.1 hypothetical protein [Pectobacterium carotovorum]MBA0202889.1 hypothetical protein [Pectobacterium carotovorum]